MERFKDRTPVIDAETFVAEGARLVGRVMLAAGASVWYNSVLRADIADIVVGENTNIQDNCVVHVESGRDTVLGRGVTVGHGAILHACTVGDNCLIGMGAILLDGCAVPRDSVVAAGSLVPPGKAYPEGSLILGSPARVARKLTAEEIEKIRMSAVHYREFWEAYAKGRIGSLKR
jgi:gamma-carbonic anhydrase